MSDKKEMICISCPVGCMLTVKETEDSIEVAGNACARGVTYGKQEYTDPRRMVTSLISVSSGARPLVPVKTLEPIPKGAITAVLAEIRNVRVNAPIKIGQVLIQDAAGTGVPVVAARDA